MADLDKKGNAVIAKNPVGNVKFRTLTIIAFQMSAAAQVLKLPSFEKAIFNNIL